MLKINKFRRISVSVHFNNRYISEMLRMGINRKLKRSVLSPTEKIGRKRAFLLWRTQSHMEGDLFYFLKVVINHAQRKTNTLIFL